MGTDTTLPYKRCNTSLRNIFMVLISNFTYLIHIVISDNGTHDVSRSDPDTLRIPHTALGNYLCHPFSEKYEKRKPNFEWHRELINIRCILAANYYTEWRIQEEGRHVDQSSSPQRLFEEGATPLEPSRTSQRCTSEPFKRKP